MLWGRAILPLANQFDVTLGRAGSVGWDRWQVVGGSRSEKIYSEIWGRIITGITKKWVVE